MKRTKPESIRHLVQVWQIKNVQRTEYADGRVTEIGLVKDCLDEETALQTLAAHPGATLWKYEPKHPEGRPIIANTGKIWYPMFDDELDAEYGDDED